MTSLWISLPDQTVLPPLTVPIAFATPAPANSIPTPPGFDPANPGDIFQVPGGITPPPPGSLPVGETPTYERSILPDAIVPPYLVVTSEVPTFTIYALVEDINYSLAPTEEDIVAELEVVTDFPTHILNVVSAELQIVTNTVELNVGAALILNTITPGTIAIATTTVQLIVGVVGNGAINATYTQSSVNPSFGLATFAQMTNNSWLGSQTITLTTPSPSWIEMTFVGGAATFNQVVLGADYAGVLDYNNNTANTDNCSIEAYVGGSWVTLVANTQIWLDHGRTFREFTVGPTTATKVKVSRIGILALTEFYCRTGSATTTLERGNGGLFEVIRRNVGSIR